MNILFWNVDTQEDFMTKGGALYIENAEDIKENLKTVTDLAEKHNIKVVNTMDWHKETDEELSDNPDFKNTFPPHCMELSGGARLIDETYCEWEETLFIEKDGTRKYGNGDNEHRNIVIFKDKFDVFEGNKQTEEVIKNINPDMVVVYGVATNICVDFAVKGLIKRGYHVMVLTDTIKGLPDSNEISIIREWSLKLGAGVGNIKILKGLLEGNK